MIYFLLFTQFFKVGLFTFGGGYAMIPLIKEVVLKYNWLAEGDFYNFIGVCESTPGPIAINMATFVGTSQAGVLGGICATFGVVLPSFIIIVLVASILSRFFESRYLKTFLYGIKPVILGLILSTGIILLVKAIGYNGDFSFNINYPSIIIFSTLILLYLFSKYIVKKKMSVILLIIVSAALGIVVCSLF